MRAARVTRLDGPGPIEVAEVEAEVAVLAPDRVFRFPDHVGFEAGAGLLFNDLTVYFALTVRGRLAHGETVLVHGAAGGIETSALRLGAGLRPADPAGTGGLPARRGRRRVAAEPHRDGESRSPSARLMTRPRPYHGWPALGPTCAGADPRWPNPAVDPDERDLSSPPGSEQEPDRVGPLLHVTASRPVAMGGVPGGTAPSGTPVIGNLADDPCSPGHTRRLFVASGRDDRHDKEKHEIPGTTHYCAGHAPRDQFRAAVDIVTDRLVRHDFARP